MQAATHMNRVQKHIQPRVTAAPASGRPAQTRARLLRPPRAAGIEALTALDTNTLIAGGIALLAAVGVAVGASQQPAVAPSEPEAACEAAIVPENAVLVFGGKGRTGRLVVEQLLRSGRTVVAAVRSADKAAAVFSELGLSPGRHPSGGALLLRGGVDVTDESSITPQLFEGVSQVVIAMGAVAGRLPDGSVGYAEGGAPKDVEGKGVATILKTMRMYMAPEKRRVQEVVPMRSAEDLAVWARTFRMAVAPSEDGRGAVVTGSAEADGAVCAARSSPLDLDLSGYDGVVMRVKSDGTTYQLDVKTAAAPDTVYEALIETNESGDWATVALPFHDFAAVRGGTVDPDAEPLTGAGIVEMSLALSQYGFNRMPNMQYHSGKFELAIDGGISAYRDPRPQLVVLSSAGVERNALLGDNAEARAREAAIVQENPGSVLNWKYEAECGVRASGFPYAVVRCTALDCDAPDAAEPSLLEADQGDMISGKVARSEAAAVMLAALGSPDSANKTFELRRSEAVDARGKAMGPRQFTRMFLKLSPDAARWRVGLPPFPALLLPQAPAAGPEKASTDAAAAAAAAALADKKAAKPAAKSEAEQSEAKSEAAQSEAKDVDAEEAKEKELASTNA